MKLIPEHPTVCAPTISSVAEVEARAHQSHRRLKELGFWVMAFWAPLAVFIGHSLMFWPWIIDDAAISFAYSRSLASGAGLVAQMGAPPVEGYSNLTWVLLMTPFYRLHLFDPIWTPKIVSLFLVALVFFGCARLARWQTLQTPAEARPLLLWPATWLVNWLLAINTSFVVWCSSGLENPLYAVLLLALAGAVLLWLRDPTRARILGVAMGILAALAAMTRPDGLCFAFAFPLVSVLIPPGASPAKPLRRATLGYYAFSYAIAFGGFVAFRWFYFGDWVPNTFHAKVGTASSLFDGAMLWNKLASLCLGVLSLPSALVLVALVWVFVAARRDRARTPLLVSVVFLALGIADYLAMPMDWMGEYRFATPVALFGALTIAQLFVSGPGAPLPRDSALKLAAVALLLTVSAANFWPRSQGFAASPTVPYQLVAREFGFVFNNYARQLQVKNGSLLLPDVGGTLLHSRLRIYDAAMLTDRRIALTLDKDQPAFYDYVFAEVRPTFIHTHGYWAYLAQFDADPRFRRDYVAIHEEIEPQFSAPGKNVMRGDYVRRDALNGIAVASLQRDESEPN